MDVTEMIMIVVVDGHTFQKDIGAKSKGVYSEEYGVYLPNTKHVFTFPELINVARAWLKEQD